MTTASRTRIRDCKHRRPGKRMSKKYRSCYNPRGPWCCPYKGDGSSTKCKYFEEVKAYANL